jgi:hypothetical protein
MLHKFGPGNKVGFPSVTAGWIISDEGFFGESSTVNFLKLRGSYGIVVTMQSLIMAIFLNLQVAVLVFDGVIVREEQLVKFQS